MPRLRPALLAVAGAVRGCLRHNGRAARHRRGRRRPGLRRAGRRRLSVLDAVRSVSAFAAAGVAPADEPAAPPRLPSAVRSQLQRHRCAVSPLPPQHRRGAARGGVAQQYLMSAVRRRRASADPIASARLPAGLRPCGTPNPFLCRRGHLLSRAWPPAAPPAACLSGSQHMHAAASGPTHPRVREMSAGAAGEGHGSGAGVPAPR